MKVADAGFDEWSLFHSWDTENKGSRYANPSFDHNGKIVGPLDGKYGPDTSVAFILDFFSRHRDEPTFVYYPMSLPHWPMVPTPDSEIWKEPRHRLDESTDYFPDMVEYMDKVIGQLADGLDELGLSENTLIVFYSDNGTDLRITSRFQGQDIQGGKATPRQTGIRVPLIAYQPGTIDAGQTISDLVDASDFLPTLAEVAGVEVPEAYKAEGHSFADFLLGERDDRSRRSSCFFWYDPRPGWDKERFRRHIFALDHEFKLFSDGRFFDISGDGFREEELDVDSLSNKQREAFQKLGKVIEAMMQPPLSPGARVERDAYGEPVLED